MPSESESGKKPASLEAGADTAHAGPVGKSSLIEDFVRYKNEKSQENREGLIRRICEQYNSNAFMDQEKQIIHEILTILAQDVEKTIRQTLSEYLKNANELPHEIALRLANDVEDVSMPMLQFSRVLTDLDLQMIVRSTGEIAKLNAIASRDNLSAVLSDMLVDKEAPLVTETLLKNQTATISEKSLEKVIAHFSTTESMMGLLINRGGLSVGLAERLISVVSEALQVQLAEKYDLKPSIASRTVASAREEMTLGVVSRNAKAENTNDLVNHLFSSGKLSHSIVLRALCRADLKFFEAGMAKLSGIPVVNARKLIREGDSRAFAALFHAASMPPTMLEATEALLHIIIEDAEALEREESKTSSSHLIERIVSNGFDKKIPNMSYFMALIGSTGTATKH